MSAETRFLDIMAGAVALITVPRDEGAPVTSTVTTVASYSLDPPSVLVGTPRHLPVEERFGVSALTTDQEHLAAVGWGVTTDLDTDAWLDGLPVATGSLINLACRVSFRHATGDHVLLVGDVTAIEFGSGSPLIGPGGPFGIGAGSET